MSLGKPPPPIADAGRDVVVQPGEEVTLNGIESIALGGARITDFTWNLESGNEDLNIEVNMAEHGVHGYQEVEFVFPDTINICSSSDNPN